MLEIEHGVSKSIYSWGLAFICSLLPVVATATALPSKEAVPYAEGQAYTRLFQDYLMPGTCGIILERSQCNDDFQSAHALRGNDPTDLAMQKWLASGDLELAPKEWNGAMVTEEAWTANPAFAWWYTAGLASVAAGMPHNEGSASYVSGILEVLKKHIILTPEPIRPALSGSETFSTAHHLQVALDVLQPVQPFPSPVFGDSPADDARLGVYFATVQELVDNPLALSRPESRAFATMVVARVQSLHDALHDGASFVALQQVLSGDIPTSAAVIDATLRQPLSHSLSPNWPLERRNAFVLGMMIAQSGYNAAVLKDLKGDQDFRGLVSTLPPYAGMTREAHDAVAALQNVPYGKWTLINPAAAKATLAIIGHV